MPPIAAKRGETNPSQRVHASFALQWSRAKRLSQRFFRWWCALGWVCGASVLMRTLQGYNCVATPDTSVLGALTSTIWAKIYIYHLYVGYDLHVNIITKSTTDRKKVNVRGAQCMCVRATQECWPRCSWIKRSGAWCATKEIL